MTVIRAVLLVAAFLLITIAVGWWGVAAVGVLWGWTAGSRVRRQIPLAGVAAGVAWLALIAWTALGGAVGRLLERLSPVLAVPSWGIVVATIAIGTILAVSGAWVGTTLRRRPSGPEASVDHVS